MRAKKYLDTQRKWLQESVEFFSAENKVQRELWVANTFLENLNVSFDPQELLSIKDDPPDVQFREARFEIKEIMDSGRKRHDEYKLALERARSAKSPGELVVDYSPKEITLVQVYELALARSKDYQKKYTSSFCRTLDLLFYVNLQDVTILIDQPFPDVTELQMCPWRSVSFVMGFRACVLAASTTAPQFILESLGVVTLRRNKTV